MESWIQGDDWWHIDRKTKHLLASEARSLYSAYWDRYFKFSVVRNPYTRVPSCLKYAEYFGIKLDAGTGRFDFSDYHSRFGHDPIIEKDYRFPFVSRGNHNHSAGCVFGNVLDEKLDFVARLETIEHDMQYVKNRIGHKSAFHHHIERGRYPTHPELTGDDQAKVAKMYEGDFARFGYYKSYSMRSATRKMPKKCTYPRADEQSGKGRRRRRKVIY